MLEAPRDAVDPAVYERNQFGLLLGLVAHNLDQSQRIIALRDGSAAAAGRSTHWETVDVENPSNRLGQVAVGADSDRIRQQIAELLGSEPMVTDQDYLDARGTKQEAEVALTDFVAGYHDFLRGKLAGAYGAEDEGQADADAWTATWRKVEASLEGHETWLAATIRFFDGVTRERFDIADSATATEIDTAVREDNGARTFYAVFGDRLPAFGGAA